MTLRIPALLFLLMLTPSLAAADNAPADSFTTDLYTHLAATTPQTKNLFFSPFSIRTALAMTAAGARGNTATQMSAVLHLDPADKSQQQFQNWIHTANNDADFQLDVANGLWLQSGYDIQPSFLTLLQHDYAAELKSVDFATAASAARQQINQWVADQTHDKIQDLLPADALDHLTRLVLANAVYFKAKWNNPFDPDVTRPREFHIDPNQSPPVPFMNKAPSTFNYLQTPQFQAVELPYRGNEMSMVLLVPTAIDGLPDLEKSLTAAHLTQWLAGLQPRLVQLSLPRFKMTTGFQLADVLSAMGMPDAFNPARADFSAIASPQQAKQEPPLFISQVYHKAYVAVGEEGTEAAAATAVAMRAGAIMRRPDNLAIVVADHPFLFLIRHRATNTILFIGRVADPR